MVLSYVAEGRGDRGAWFRMQEVRSIEEYDTLLQRKEQLKADLGAEKSAEIEDNPDIFVDAEKFRKFHAKARFRSVVTTAGAVMAGSTIAAQQLGFANGRAFLRAYPYSSLGVTLATWVVSYHSWHFIAGFRTNEMNELKYARYIRMLRNA